MIRQILWKQGAPVEHDDDVSELDMRAAMPNFFRNRFGKRETYTFHRGFIICRYTAQFTGCRPTRKTVLYLYSKKDRDVFHIDGAGNSVRSAMRRVDWILENKRLVAPSNVEVGE